MDWEKVDDLKLISGEYELTKGESGWDLNHQGGWVGNFRTLRGAKKAAAEHSKEMKGEPQRKPAAKPAATKGLTPRQALAMRTRSKK